MSDLISSEAALGALEERQSKYRRETSSWVQIHMDILTIRAVPTVTPGIKVKPTDAQVASACMSYRHDFGLLGAEDRQQVMRQARFWLEAWQKELDLTPQPAPDVAGLVEAATGLLSAVGAYADTPPQSSAEALASCDVATAAEAVRAALAAMEGKP